MLRECVRYESLANFILSDKCFYDFFIYVELSTFDIASDAFASFKVGENIMIISIHTPYYLHTYPLLCPYIPPIISIHTPYYIHTYPLLCPYIPPIISIHTPYYLHTYPLLCPYIPPIIWLLFSS